MGRKQMEIQKTSTYHAMDVLRYHGLWHLEREECLNFQAREKPNDKLIRDIVSSIHDQVQIKWHKDPKLHDYLSLWT